MKADDIDHYDAAHDLEDDHDWAMSVMDRLASYAPYAPYAPYGATNLDGCLEAASRTSSPARHAPVPRQPSENPDETRVARVLYGARSGDVSPATPRRLNTSFCHCCTPNNNDGATAGTGRAA